MNKRGFTLIELLAVISLLAIIALVALPAVENALKEGKENLTETQKQQIIKGAKEFFAEHISCLPDNDSSKCTYTCSYFKQNNSATQIGVSCLQTLGYLPANIADFNKKDDGTGRSYDADTVVKVTKSGNNYTYQVTKWST